MTIRRPRLTWHHQREQARGPNRFGVETFLLFPKCQRAQRSPQGMQSIQLRFQVILTCRQQALPRFMPIALLARSTVSPPVVAAYRPETWTGSGRRSRHRVGACHGAQRENYPPSPSLPASKQEYAAEPQLARARESMEGMT